MKVVINGCFGGFGLSYAAVKAIMERKGLPCYGYRQIYNGFKAPYTYERCKGNEKAQYYCFVSDKGDAPSDHDIKEAFSNETEFDEMSFDNPEARTDPDLIAVVEKLGDKASGVGAKLYVVEIPDDIPNGWHISDYDGSETIEENHRTWC